MKHSKKILALAMSIAVVASIAAAGTLAYLTSTTDEVTNTFTVGDIQIELQEHEYLNDGTLGEDLVMENIYSHVLPGATLPKDPFITVKADSEECWIYAMVLNGLNNVVDNAATPAINEDWTQIYADEGNVVTIYRMNYVVADQSMDTRYPVFNTVSISPDLDNDDLAAVNNQAIVIKAFAHQATNVEQAVADAAAVETLLNTLAVEPIV